MWLMKPELMYSSSPVPFQLEAHNALSVSHAIGPQLVAHWWKRFARGNSSSILRRQDGVESKLDGHD